MDSDTQLREGCSILCVEDDAVTREFLRRLVALKYPCCNVHTADNGRTGLEAFHAHDADIVLTDLNMPVMDGVRMAREMRVIKPGVLIIAITAYGISDCPDAEEHLALFDHYLLKPVNRKPLCEAIEDCMARVSG